MGAKKRAVVNAEAGQLERIEALVASRRYRSLSDFVREAVDEKLARIDRDLLADEVARYCAAGHAGEDDELIGAQAIAFAPVSRARRPTRRQRATR
jgi:Arc/MetJ-type ribon-helix-helix transcriptional regulator